MTTKSTTSKTTKTTKTKPAKANKRQFATSLKCNKDWFSSNKVRPKTIIIVAERTQDGYRIENATVRVAVNQHTRTVIPVDNLKDLVQDMNQRGIRI